MSAERGLSGEPSTAPAEAELAYLRNQLDEVGAENLRLTTRIQVAQRELTLRRRGFELLARLGATLGAHTEIETALAAVLPIVEAELQVQRVVALRREDGVYRPYAWSGYPSGAAGALNDASIELPPTVETGEGVIATGDGEPEQWLVAARAQLGVPVFVAVPLAGSDHALLVGRLAERAGFFPRFDQVDLDTLKAVADLIPPAVENTKLAALAEIKRFLPPAVAHEVLSGRLHTREGYRREEVTVLAADLVGFTPLAERLTAADLAALLNAYIHEMTSLANASRGTVGSIAGDGVIVIFGAPERQSPQEHARAAASTAFAMQERIPDLGRDRLGWQGAPLGLRVGISTGVCSVGTFGSDTQCTYTAIGLPVNLAARLESAAEPGEVLVAPKTLELLGETVRGSQRQSLALKGIAAPVTATAISPGVTG